ncbi:Cytidylate kinase [Hartmannibacter diazotrophicus]|uniref:Cytidylate kinase n=1 Tax=Hartmannibacter diazotrophicus TaxID=1482074 RepID=A0A2C9DEA3_9HYPH|nr:(d)CMP kinase [Hartmannibacter diazotrophicus]SON58125.1 Cytidylate kinase [Hartmannibacter diazotrophicus]
MIIAIDGPAASGKGTLSRRLASHFGFSHLDTGLLYRAVGEALRAKGLDPADEPAAVTIAETLDTSALDRDRLSGSAIGEAASIVAAIPAVRAALLDLQRRFAHSGKGAILDGRDIGTVVCPEAEVKLFVTASPEARARRRHRDDLAINPSVTYESVLADILKRDARDSGRTVAPLVPAPDARLLDTTDLDIEEAFQAAVRLVEAAG